MITIVVIGVARRDVFKMLVLFKVSDEPVELGEAVGSELRYFFDVEGRDRGDAGVVVLIVSGGIGGVG